MADTDTGELVNPFPGLAELVRNLRDRFVAELGTDRPLSAHSGEVLGAMAALATRCDHLGSSLSRLRDNDPDSYTHFLRALGDS